ncbi:MAG: 50S ribosomal protein L11 methyltransferase [Cryobacterium sp.]|nr:50S ribosomal protein L11 methyltransferase [Oligoflexia bacterium]
MPIQIKLKNKLAPDTSPPIKPTVKEVAAGLREFTGEDVSLWHFAMMNDEVRNGAYDRALGGAVKPGTKVLDIGTGAGLLALMAARHGGEVTTCEGIPVIAKKAKEIFQANGYSEKIRGIEGLSTKLVIGKDVKERFDVLVTEIFDDGLLGEGAFLAIKHAKEHLLKPGAKIIPESVQVYVMGIESDEFFSHYHVEKAAGFDVSAFNEFTLQGYIGWHLDKWKWKALTAPTPVFHFDFNQLPNAENRPLDLEITTAGHLHGLAFWFDLKMDDNTVLSSGPGLAKLSSWKQALQLYGEGRECHPGSKIELTARHDENEIWFSTRNS